MALFVKLASSATVSTLVFARFVLGVPIFLWIVRKKKIDLTWKNVPKNFIRSLAGILNLYAFYLALHILPLVNAVTLSSTAPLFLPLLTLVWLKVLVSKRRFFAVGIGFVGVCVILRPSATEFLVIGSLLGLFSGLCRAVAILNVRRLAKTETTETILVYYFFIGAVLSVFPVFLDWRPFTNLLQWLYVFLAGALALVYQFAFTKACAHTSATKIGSFSYLGVVLGGLLGWWIFGEIPDLWVLAGTILIICGALISLFDQTPSIHLRKD